MPAKAKTLENMAKHLTREECEARTDAEASTIPKRDKVSLKKPQWLGETGSLEVKLWNSVIGRMKGLGILDDLDAEMLAIYCRNVGERTRLEELLAEVRKPVDDNVYDIKTLVSLDKQISTIDGRIADYAERLGLTPSGRARLAQKRAQQDAEKDPDADLFG